MVTQLLTLAEFGDTTETDPNGSSETLRDGNGNITAQIVYDSAGNITLFAIYPDTGGKVVITSAYDADGNLSSHVCTTYDTDGNIISQETLPLASESTETTEPAPVNIGVIPNPPTANEESVFSSVSSPSSLSSEADLWLLEAELLYDGGGMLMSSPSGPSLAWTNEFVYDRLGNRYQSIEDYGFLTDTYEYSHNSVNQYQTISEWVPGRTPDTYSVSYDENGNLAEWGWTYQYDYRNRLTKIELETDTIAEYTYDALGRRICKTVGDTTTYFYYDTDNRVIAEYVKPQNEEIELDRSFVYGNDITEVLAMFLYEKPYSQEDVDLLFGFFDCWLTVSGGTGYNDSYDYVNDNVIDLKDWAVLANREWNLPEPLPDYETRFYYLTDALGSVRGLIGGRLNRKEDREFYNYGVYGTPTDYSTSAAGNPFMFAGYYFDAETCLYYLINRTYDPYTGRFLQFDPIEYVDSMNLYEYAGSNSIMFIDPWGMAYRVSSDKLVAIDTGCGIYLGLPIEEFVPTITYNPYGGPIGESWEPKILWFNHSISPDKMSQGKYDSVQKMLEERVNASNQQERLDGLVTAAEMTCNTVPFFDAAYKACYDKDLTGAAKSAAIEGGIYLASYGTAKLINCGLKKCAKLGEVAGEGYSHLKDSKYAGAGKEFTQAQKRNIFEANRARNNGIIRSDQSGKVVVPAQKHLKGVTPAMNEAQVDHIIPRSKGGTNSYSNAQVLTREENISKGTR